jgi:hypothetical protein
MICSDISHHGLNLISLLHFFFAFYSANDSNCVSKSSSSTGSENWSTISPHAVVNMLDLYYPSGNAPDEEDHEGVAFELLGADPLEWLIETDCTQHYLPESSLPLFPYLHDDKMIVNNNEWNDDEEFTRSENEPGMVEDALLHNMVDPHVTMQSLFSSCNDDSMQQ